MKLSRDNNNRLNYSLYLTKKSFVSQIMLTDSYQLLFLQCSL